MKNKLNEAFQYVDDTYLDMCEQSDTKYKRPKYRTWALAFGSLLIVVSVLWRSASPLITTTYAISQAQYPQMAPYPTKATLNENSEKFEKAYEAWRESLTAQRQDEGYGDNYTQFLANSMSEVLIPKQDENRIYAPINVYLALGMLSEITDNESRQQILTVLGEERIEDVRQKAYALWNASYRDDGAVKSVLASSLWLNDTINYNKDTLDILADTYFASSYQGAMGDTNYTIAFQQWLSEQTGGLLEKEAKEIILEEETHLALATTINFHAKWNTEFQEKNTTKDIFHSVNEDIPCEFMHYSRSSTYYWADHFAAISQGLESGGRMWFLLPDENVSMTEFINDTSVVDFLLANGNWENHKYVIVNAALPKFDVTSQLDLQNSLNNLGVVDVFNPCYADFSPLTMDKQAIYLSQIQHDARVMIDEEGVSAVAYTVMHSAGAAEPPDEEVDFIVNRPFLFAITNPDGLPMFIGLVQQP